MSKSRNIQIAVALTIVAMAVLAIVVLTADGSGDTDAVSNGGQGDVPEFVDVFGPEPPAGDTTPVDRPSCEREERISWTEAEQYINQKVAIIGAVTDVQDEQDGVTLTIGRTEDEVPVTVRITESALNRLPDTPEKMFGDDALCVIGVLQAVGSRIQVVVNEPTDIAVF